MIYQILSCEGVEASWGLVHAASHQKIITFWYIHRQDNTVDAAAVIQMEEKVN